MTVSEYLKKNAKRADAIRIQQQLPQFSYHKIWRTLKGETEPDPVIVTEAIKLFAERKKQEENQIRQFEELES